MRLDNVLKSGRLIFVCHSMGGIIARKYILQKANDFIEKGTEIGLFLIASPSLGAEYAKWLIPLAKFFGHTQLDALAFSQKNVWLNDLNKQFRDLISSQTLMLFGKELVEDKFIVLRRFIRKQVVEPFAGATYFGHSYKVEYSDHFSIAKPKDSAAIQHRLLCQFIEDASRLGADVGRIQESDNELRAQINGCTVKLVFGRIEEFPRLSDAVMVLPCNEYFDDDCANDLRSALGAYVNKVFEGRAAQFRALINKECRKKLGRPTKLQKTNDIQAESFGPGHCLLLIRPLGDSSPIALVSSTTQREGRGLVAQVSYLFGGMSELFARLADEKIYKIVMPILGSGHGGLNSPLALTGLLLAIAEAANYSQGSQRPKNVTIVIFKKDSNSRADVDLIVARRALALITSKG